MGSHFYARIELRVQFRSFAGCGEVRATCVMGTERGWRAAGAGNGKRRRAGADANDDGAARAPDRRLTPPDCDEQRDG